jgi:predicted anti-sigma-YlaC factor YlaD
MTVRISSGRVDDHLTNCSAWRNAISWSTHVVPDAQIDSQPVELTNLNLTTELTKCHVRGARKMASQLGPRLWERHATR